MILVFTDGQDTSHAAEAAAQEAAAQGFVVQVIGLVSHDSVAQDQAQRIAQQGQGQFFLASNPAQLATLFRNTQLFGIYNLMVTNKTTGVMALNVNFAAGSYSAPVELVLGDNQLEVTALSTSGKTATASVMVKVSMICPTPNVPGTANYVAQCPTVCPTPNVPGTANYAAQCPMTCLTPNVLGTANYVAQCSTVPDSYVVRTRPQVLMAGFDPILLDIGDDEFKVMAVVREGEHPIRRVVLSDNAGVDMDMNLEGQLPNGDKVYSWRYIATGFRLTMGNIFSLGSQPDQFKITVMDEASQTHTFAALEIDHHQSIARDNPLTTVSLYQTKGIKRGRPQTLMAGFDPAMIDVLDTSFKVKAIVRPGSVAIRSVTLKSNDTAFLQKMLKESDLPNGDVLFATEIRFSPGALSPAILQDLFGTAAGQFVVETIDEGSQSHAFPVSNVCDCPKLF